MHVLAVAGYDKLNSNGSGALRYMVRVPAPGIPPARLEPGCVHGHIPMALPFAGFAHSERLYAMHAHVLLRRGRGHGRL